MATTTSFKDIVSLPQWRPLTPTGYQFSAGAGIVGDLRNNEDRHPILFWFYSNTQIGLYNVKNDSWGTAYVNPSMAASPSAGAGMVFCPSQGPNGTIAAGATTTTLTLTTALPAAVGVNQLANRGDGVGFKIRIIGNSAGGSGKTEERYIVANTSGTTPLIEVDSVFSFTPALGDRYEILAGRLYILVSNSASGGWKYYDVATNSMSSNLSTTNLPTISTDSSFIALDEQHVPADKTPGQGFFGNLTATAAGATSLTGHATGGDSAVLINEYRNFQIRIVEDTGTPTAAGQRRNITSHTAGASPVYTVAAWTVQPSATATYVIENNTDRILLWVGGQQGTYTYSVSGNAWDASTTFATRGAAMAVGCMSVQAFGITPDTARNARHSYIYSFRGGSAATLDLFDIAGAATGAWTLNVAYGGVITPGGGHCMEYAPATEGGRYAYITNANVTQYSVPFSRFDVKNRVVEGWTSLPYAPGAANTSAGHRLATTVFVDGATKLSFVHVLVNTINHGPHFQCLITR